MRKDQKNTIGLLSIGNFLDHFDLMLYLHTAILLNDLFFSQPDHSTANLLSALAFCSTYLLRPFGELFFGYIGYHIGNKFTLVITTLLISLSCLITSNLPTYTQVGMTSAWLITLCRILQGMSSTGDITGAQVYLTTTIKNPACYLAVTIVDVVSNIGGIFALLIATIATTYGENWKATFFVGAVIAQIGFVARLKIRELAEYIYSNHNNHAAKQYYLDNTDNDKRLNYISGSNDKIDTKTLLAYFVMESVAIIYFYLNFIYCGNYLRYNFNYTAAQVIVHNLLLSIGFFILNLILAFFYSNKSHPLKIIKLKLYFFIPIIVFFPVIAFSVTPTQLLLLQIIFMALSCTAYASSAIFLNLPTLKHRSHLNRTSFIFAISKSCMYLMASFGLEILVKYLGNLGFWIILIPFNIAYILALHYFENMEKNVGNINISRVIIKL